MRGSIKRRYKGSWSLILDLGYEPHPETGKPRRRQKYVTFRGSKKEAEKRLAKLISQVHEGGFVEPSKVTLAQWLREWLEIAVKPPRCRPATYARYQGIIDHDIASAPLGNLPVQKIRPSHIEAYYAAATVSPATLSIHHAILHRALRKAAKDHLIATNPATDLDGRPRRARDKSAAARTHCWTPEQAKAFLVAARDAGPQPAAFYALALDSGMRKGELCGLQWSDLDLDAGKAHVVQQFLTPGPEPAFGPTKTGAQRTISLSAETVALLRTHRRHQRELRLANGPRYRDFGLVFAKEWKDLAGQSEQLGLPLQANNLGQREYATLVTAAEVPRIKFHGLRHTCATLLLRAGHPPHVVAERLGHAKVSMTMEVYAHVLPDMQRDAAATMGALLYGSIK